MDLRKNKKVKQGNASKFKYERFVPPLKVASHLLARPDRWTYPELVGVIETPTLRKDGTLLVHEGYDAASVLLFDANGVEFPEIKDQPTRADAVAALDFLKIPFKDFPFVSDGNGDSPSRSVALSADSDHLRAAVDALGYEGNAKGLGKFLQFKHGQIIDGVRLEMTRDKHAKINLYRATKVDEPDFG